MRPGCYLETGQVRCTGAFIGLLALFIFAPEKELELNDIPHARKLNFRTLYFTAYLR